MCNLDLAVENGGIFVAHDANRGKSSNTVSSG